MSVRYISFDPGMESNHRDLRAFIKRYGGKAVNQSLVRFETESDLGTFRDELHQAVDDDSSVFILIRTKDGMAHGKPGRG